MIVGKVRVIYFGGGFHVKITEFPSHFCVVITHPLWYIVGGGGACDWLPKPFGERERGGPHPARAVSQQSKANKKWPLCL